MARTPLDNMAWHHDMQVRDIYSEIDDRSPDEIAEGIMEVHHQYNRAFEEPKETEHLSRDDAVAASILASQYVDWANYATAYNDYSNPPWERAGNPGTDTRKLKSKLLR